MKPAASTHAFAVGLHVSPLVVGSRVGTAVGSAVGWDVGADVGANVSPAPVGLRVGDTVGDVGPAVGLHVSPRCVTPRVGDNVGSVGFTVGLHVCPADVGARVGALDGRVGPAVGLSVWPQNVGLRLCVVGLLVGLPLGDSVEHLQSSPYERHVAKDEPDLTQLLQPVPQLGTDVGRELGAQVSPTLVGLRVGAPVGLDGLKVGLDVVGATVRGAVGCVVGFAVVHLQSSPNDLHADSKVPELTQ